MHARRPFPSSSRTALAGAALLLAAGAAPASAAVTPTVVADTGEVRLIGDDAADIVVPVCEAGQLRAAPGEDPLLACAAVVTLTVRGEGGADDIDLRAITRTAFPAISTIVATGSNGAGVIEGSPLDDVLSGQDSTIRGNAGDDLVEFSANAEGGAGDDLLFGGDTVDGGDGDDLISRAGTSVGGPGDDLIVSPDGPSQGGAGVDVLQLGDLDDAPVDLTLTVTDTTFTVDVPSFAFTQTAPATGIEMLDVTLASGDQTLDTTGFSGSVVADLGAGDDVALGGAGDDVLRGSTGDDRLVGGTGADLLDGGPGADDIAARDGVADVVRCGTGADAVVADRADALRNCESSDVPPAPPTAPPVAPATAPPAAPAVPAPVVPVAPASPLEPVDTVRPTVRLSSARLRGRRLSLVAACPATEIRCLVVADLRVTGRRGRRTVRVEAGTAVVVVPGGTQRTVTRTLSAARARSAGRLSRRRAAVRTTVVDVAGNTSTASRTLTLSTRR